MGKKNKGAKQNAPKNNLETVQKKGGSTISKAKDLGHVKGKGKGGDNKKPVNIKSKVVDENKLQDVSLKLNKKKNKNKKANLTNGSGENKKQKDASPANQKSPTIQQENGKKDEKIVKLTKREKNRVKSKMSKDIAMDGKSKLGLADPKLVARQLKKLTTTAEPLSKSKQRKVLLLEKLNKKLQKDNKTKTPNTTLNSDSGDDDETNTSGASKTSPNKKGKTDARKEKDKLFLFVGNLPANVTDDMIREVFKSVGNLEKIKIPVPKRKKSKRFAYIKLGDEESKQKALQLHGSMLGERKITVLYSDKSKGKSGLVSINAKLNAERKATTTPKGATSPASTNGSPAKSNKKNKNKKNKKGKGVST